MDRIECYIGSYTKLHGRGIYHTETFGNQMNIISVINADNPSWVTSDGNYLYFVDEKKGGAVSSLALTKESSEEWSSWSTQGDDPCHITKFRNRLFVANYTSGSLAEFTVGMNGTCSLSHLYQHTGKSIHPTRQTRAHVHHSIVTHGEEYLTVTDLGEDTVSFYPIRVHSEESLGEPYTLRIPSGNGPRHIALGTEEAWYVACELTGAIFVYRGYGKNAEMIQSLAPSQKQYETGDASGIRLSPDGRWLIMGMRGTNRLEVFEVCVDQQLKHRNSIQLPGSCPRDFAFEPHNDKLLCACQDSSQVLAYRLQNCGQLELLAAWDVPSPTCICFHK